MVLGAVGVDLDGSFVGSLGTVEGFVEGWEQCRSSWNAQAGVLALSNEGFKGFGFAVALSKGGSDGVSDGLHFRGWELHGSVQAIKDPAQYFLADVPDAFPFEH